MTIKYKFTDSKSNKLDWDRLKVFYALAHSGTLEKTHELTGIPVSSISYHIKELEKDLGIPLINRNKGTQGNILTEAGQVFFKATTDLYKRIEDAISEVENKEEISGKISIATAKGFGISWLFPKLVNFMKIHPDIIFEISLVDIFPNLVNCAADLYISPKFGEASNLIHSHLGRYEYRTYASQAYIDKFGAPTTPEDLDHHKIIAWKYKSIWAEANWLLTSGLQKGIEREPVLILEDVNMVLSAVENGLGISQFVQYIEDYSPKLLRILQNYDMGAIDLYLIRSPGNTQIKRINLLTSYLKKS